MDEKKKSTDYRTRLTIDLREDQAQKIRAIVPHGQQKLLFQALVDGVFAIYDTGGYVALSMIISKHISLQQIAKAGEGYTKEHFTKERN
jgi:hypothetical protein